jgi:hypothetical protein
MTLLLDLDRDHRTGWCGYDYCVNRTIKSDRTSLLEAHDGRGKWVERAAVTYQVSANQIELAIPRSDLQMTSSDPAWFQFKWADNVGPLQDPSEFLINGDTAPNARFNYVVAPVRAR